MIGRILSDRSAYGMSADDRALHGLLDTLTPGEFRASAHRDLMLAP